jgi:serine phosphatase RsbU (regulator of sigma subunit)
MGNVEYHWFTHNNLLVSIVMQAVLFSLANAQKIKLLKETNELLLLGEKEQLEKMVNIRTSELQLEKRNVEGQKRVIEEKQIEIIDSINYAKRIQYALLAHDNFLSLHIPNNFIYFNPKDIVSGDFYWATKKDNKFYLAVCDSTGHGVPGAFMSLLNIGFLSEAINEKNIAKPNEVFNYVRQRLIDSLGKGEQKDGFDGILICIDRESKNITYSAANNKPILVSNQQIIELKSDRMPVGIGEKKENFNLYNINYTQGDYLYLYTDGYADQFGGPKGKKFKYKPLNELLLINHLKPEHEQKNILVNNFNNWRNNLEQVDDVLIIGIKL